MIGLLEGNGLLALAAAALWGGGDFSGGMGVKLAGGRLGAALRIVLLSHAMSFVVLLGVAWLRRDAFPHGATLAAGLVAGVAGGLALTGFYIALARGAMGASAAVSGLLAAAIPAALTLWMDGSPGLRRIVGFAAAALAIWLIAAGRPETPVARSTVGLAIAAGAGFGIYFVALKLAGPAGVIWPMATARMGSLTACSLLFAWLGLRESWRPEHPPGARRAESAGGYLAARIGPAAVLWAASTALLDTSGNLLFVAATRAGRLDVAAVLASLYPASTILLAALMLGERPTRRQGWGMAVALAAVLLIAG